MKRLGMKYMYSYEEQWQPKDKYVILGILDKKNQSFYEHFGCFNVIKIPIDITNKEFEEIIDLNPKKNINQYVIVIIK